MPGDGRRPVMALMPSPGDVDVVVASELVEAGRAMQRGLVTPDRTTLIASTHRAYTVSEKSNLTDGRVDSSAIIDEARRQARRFIAFDMAELAEQRSAVISSVILGALAGAAGLPFGLVYQAIRAAASRSRPTSRPSGRRRSRQPGRHRTAGVRIRADAGTCMPPPYRQVQPDFRDRPDDDRARNRAPDRLQDAVRRAVPGTAQEDHDPGAGGHDERRAHRGGGATWHSGCRSRTRCGSRSSRRGRSAPRQSSASAYHDDQLEVAVPAAGREICGPCRPASVGGCSVTGRRRQLDVHGQAAGADVDRRLRS